MKERRERERTRGSGKDGICLRTTSWVCWDFPACCSFFFFLPPPPLFSFYLLSLLSRELFSSFDNLTGCCVVIIAVSPLLHTELPIFSGELRGGILSAVCFLATQILIASGECILCTILVNLSLKSNVSSCVGEDVAIDVHL